MRRTDMKMVLANPRGFCAGVNMAIECVERVLRLKGPPIYVYHEIVHNRHVVQRLSEQGVVFVNSIDDVPVGGTLIYSAHGVSPEVRRQAGARNLVQIDATCPLVMKVHSEAIRYAREKLAIVLIGHRGHDEVVGTLGEAPDSIHIVENTSDVQKLTIPDDQPISYLTQTTLSLDDAETIISALRQKYPRIRGPVKEDICYATTNRQMAVRQLAAECDLVLVVGSQNSSNSLRLAEIARNRGKRAFLIDDVSHLDHSWFNGVNIVLITAGASAPEDLVREIVDLLQSRYHATLEERIVTEEDVHFELPASLRAPRQTADN
ncbi:MAG: 4-hydroxy-3-methylbut-2-enyl diphosphate reductase [Planctomycetota bacterium]|nr:4-hydroxy-3-methylbut-2-enyl diphosphate reductase [Planctomycetota bacterium]